MEEGVVTAGECKETKLQVSHGEAFRIVLRHVKPLGVERKALDECFGDFLAEDVRADRDLPAADQSAMDGYAVRADDLAGAPVTLRLVGEVAAGSAARPVVKRGTCVSILTGGNVPRGADAVIMVEKTEASGGEVTFLERVEKGVNIRAKGEAARRGETVLEAGERVDRLQAAVCSAFGKARLAVRRRPRVAVVVTGQEVLTVEAKVGAHQLRDSNGPAIRAALAACGYEDVPVTIAGDDPKELENILSRAVKKSDVVLVTGGVSVGKYDYVPAAVEAVGSRIRYHGVAMKPGKPQLYATVGRNKHIFGLPGNPLSVMSGLHEFVLPAIRIMAGCREEECRPALLVRLASEARSTKKRMELVLARLVLKGGVTEAEPVRSLGSADIIAGAKADGVVLVPANTVLAEGSVVEFRPWRGLW